MLSMQDHKFLDVIVNFSAEIPLTVQAKTLMQFEKDLRSYGFDCRVLKERMADDSKLRRMMTPEERDKL